MNIEQLYQDYSVDYRTEGHKHCRPGWVNTECPWCVSDVGHVGYHLGFNIQSNGYVCWRCGFHPVFPTLMKLLRTNAKEVKQILNAYNLLVPDYREISSQVQKIEHRFPSGVMPLQKNHKKYLEDRNFDPNYLEKEWNLLGTGPIALLDKFDYRFRIMIPFIWNYVQVSFDSRDITGKHPSKYMACPKQREFIPHKEILYGKQSKWKSTGICVEGPTDVWRFGPTAFAVSGIKFTPKQVRVIASTFKRCAVCFDGGESQAITQANLLVGELKFRGVDTFRVDIEGDPGSMDQNEANYLVKQLIK